MIRARGILSLGSHSRVLRRCLSAALIVSAIVGSTEAASADDPSDLEAALAQPIVATASKSAEDESVAPATVSIITAEDIRRYGIHSLDEAINYLSMGMVWSNPLHNGDLGSRGVTITSDYGNHIALLLNGHLMNEQWGEAVYFQRGAGIPIEIVDHIEIILGPGSVLYGGSAVLGVVNVVTKKARDFDGFHAIGESDLFTTGRLAAGFGREFTLFGKPAEVTAEFEYFTQNGPALHFAPENYGNDSVTGQPKRFTFDGSMAGVWGGTINNQNYQRVPAGFLQLAWDNWTLDLHASTWTRTSPYPNGSNQAFSDFDDPRNREVDRWFNFDLRHRAPLSSVVQLRSRVYGDTYDYEQYMRSAAAEDCAAGQVNGCVIHTLAVARWIGLEEQAFFKWLPDGSVTTLLGVDGRLIYDGARTDVIDGITSFNPGSVSAYDQEKYTLAVYAQQTWRPWKPLSFNLGARLDDDSTVGTRLLPRATASIQTWKGGTFKVIYAEAFRPPTAWERYYTDGISQIANPNLQSETTRSAEASFEQRFGTNRIFIGGFRSWWGNLSTLVSITPDETNAAIAAGQLAPGSSGALQFQNAGGIDNYGFNGGFEGTAVHANLRYGLNFTGANARRTNPDGSVSPLTVGPQAFGNARISYDLPGEWPILGLAASVMGTRLADRGLDGGFTPTPYAPRQTDLRLTISGNVPFVKGLSYRLSADYAFASTAPYVIGPVQAAIPTQTSAQLAPVDQFRTSVGLRYDFR